MNTLQSININLDFQHGQGNCNDKVFAIRGHFKTENTSNNEQAYSVSL